jgi:hypothetical protein
MTTPPPNRPEAIRVPPRVTVTVFAPSHDPHGRGRDDEFGQVGSFVFENWSPPLPRVGDVLDYGHLDPPGEQWAGGLPQGRVDSIDICYWEDGVDVLVCVRGTPVAVDAPEGDA